MGARIAQPARHPPLWPRLTPFRSEGAAHQRAAGAETGAPSEAEPGASQRLPEGSLNCSREALRIRKSGGSTAWTAHCSALAVAAEGG